MDPDATMPEDWDEDEDEGKSGDGAGSGLGGGVAGGRAGREPSGEAASGDADNPSLSCKSPQAEDVNGGGENNKQTSRQYLKPKFPQRL